ESAADGDCRNFRLLDFERTEVTLQIAGAVPAAELDDGDGLSGAGDVLREVIDLRQLRRCKGSRRRGSRRDFVVPAKMRFGDWTVIEAQIRDDGRMHRGRHRKHSGARPETGAVHCVPLELRAERLLYGVRGSRHYDRAPRGIAFRDGQVM